MYHGSCHGFMLVTCSGLFYLFLFVLVACLFFVKDVEIFMFIFFSFRLFILSPIIPLRWNKRASRLDHMTRRDHSLAHKHSVKNKHPTMDVKFLNQRNIDVFESWRIPRLICRFLSQVSATRTVKWSLKPPGCNSLQLQVIIFWRFAARHSYMWMQFQVFFWAGIGFMFAGIPTSGSISQRSPT